MGVEIERKFLVDWEKFNKNTVVIDEWEDGDNFRLVNHGAGPDELQIYNKGHWGRESECYTHGILCKRIKELSMHKYKEKPYLEKGAMAIQNYTMSHSYGRVLCNVSGVHDKIDRKSKVLFGTPGGSIVMCPACSIQVELSKHDIDCINKYEDLAKESGSWYKNEWDAIQRYREIC